MNKALLDIFMLLLKGVLFDAAACFQQFTDKTKQYII